MKHAISIILILALILPVANALSATVEIQPNGPDTTDRLGCVVTPSGTGTLNANTTWYQDSTAFSDSDQTLSLTTDQSTATDTQGEVPSNETLKGEVWICQATIYNETTSIKVNSSGEEIVNSPPEITDPTTLQNATEGEPYFLAAQANDNDPSDTTITWFSNDLNSSEYGGEDLFDIQSNGVISFTPTYEQRGNHTVQLSAFDGDTDTGIGSKIIIFEVQIVNQPPTFTPALQDQQASQNTAWNYVITGDDREDDPMNFTLLSSTLNTVQLAETGADEATFTLSTTQPRYQDRGLQNITVMVHETGNLSQNTTATFTLNITVDNDPPTLDPVSNPSASQGDNYELNISASDPNTVDDTLEFFIEPSCPISNPWNITTLDDDPSSARATIQAQPLTNDHIICRDVTIRVRDFDDLGNPKAQDNQTLTLDLTNVNDAPQIFELSETPGTYDQSNMSDLEAAQDLLFEYEVRAEDPDTQTYQGDTITYDSNTTLFIINSSTGAIRFTPANEDVGTHNINISVEDALGLTDSRVMTLTINANTAPQLQPIPDTQCPEDTNCTIQTEAQDPDPAENHTFLFTNINASPKSNQTVDTTWQQTITSSNSSEWQKNYANNMVGGYYYNVSVEDRWGAQDSQIIFVNATNVNDAPIFDDNQDGIADNIILPTPFVEDFAVSFNIRATDVDFFNDEDEELNLSIDTQGPNPNVMQIPTKTAQATWFVSFTPAQTDIGNYTTTFSLTDNDGATTNTTYNYSILAKSTPPNITHITPYFNETLQETGFGLTTRNDTSTSIVLEEPNSHVFNFSYEDPDSNSQNVSVRWYIDDELVQENTGDENYAYLEQYDYFSQGNFTYHVELEDERYSSTNYTWEVEVEDSNRAPILLENMTNRNITATTEIQNLLDVFYDPDDDTSNSGSIDGNETNNLIFTYSDTDGLLDIEIDYLDVTFIPVEQGEVTIFWRATDSEGASVDSNQVTYYVDPPEDQTVEPQPSGGGGGGGSSPVPIPIQAEPEPESVQILIPEQLTIYRNETIEAPVTVRNTGERTLSQTQLSAEADVENVSFEWTLESILELQPGQEQNSTLLITNFRPDGTYDVRVTAVSQEPEVNDTAIILINSLEQSRNMDEAIQTRVTFARDLVSSNSECLELNEVLEQASSAAQRGESQEARRLIDAAIDGCRYLIGESSRRVEEPGVFSIGSWMNNYRYANHVLIGLIMTLLLAGGLILTHYLSAAKMEQEEQ